MNSCYNYLKSFENDQILPPYTWLIIRIDGRHFGMFSKSHNFRKPNEPRALALANKAAESVFSEFSDITMAYGHSDEYSFLLRADSKLYNRRREKILSGIVSIYSSAYVLNWNNYFKYPLKYPPSFDARIITCPLIEHVKDYFRWRQVDCHVNNQYNSAFWCLVSQGKSTDEAYQILKGTDKNFKNDLLYDTFQLNYNNISNLFKKGSTLIRKFGFVNNQVDSVLDNFNESQQIELKIDESEIDELTRLDGSVEYISDDIINEEFWETHSWVLDSLLKPPKLGKS